MLVENFLTSEGWDKHGANFYYPRREYPHIHMILKARNASGTAWSGADVGAGNTHAAVKAAYQLIASWVDMIALGRGPDHGGGINFVTDGSATPKADPVKLNDILIKELPKFTYGDDGDARMADISNKLAYILPIIIES